MIKAQGSVWQQKWACVARGRNLPWVVHPLPCSINLSPSNNTTKRRWHTGRKKVSLFDICRVAIRTLLVGPCCAAIYKNTLLPFFIWNHYQSDTLYTHVHFMIYSVYTLDFTILRVFQKPWLNEKRGVSCREKYLFAHIGSSFDLRI